MAIFCWKNVCLATDIFFGTLEYFLGLKTFIWGRFGGQFYRDNYSYRKFAFYSSSLPAPVYPTFPSFFSFLHFWDPLMRDSHIDFSNWSINSQGIKKMLKIFEAKMWRRVFRQLWFLFQIWWISFSNFGPRKLQLSSIMSWKS